MSIWGKLFGSDSVIEKAADGIYNGVDKAFHTSEEKAEHFLNLLKAYEPFKLAQRLLALGVIGSYLLVWLVTVIVFIAGGLTESVDIQLARELGELNNETLGLPAGLILGFYFGGGALEGVVTRFKKK